MMNIDIDKMAQSAFDISIDDLSDQITQLNNLVDTLKLVRDIRIRNTKKSSHHTKKKLSKSVSNVVDQMEKKSITDDKKYV